MVCSWCHTKSEVCLNVDCKALLLPCPIKEHQDLCRYSKNSFKIKAKVKVRTKVKEMPWADELAAEKERNRWYE